MSFGAWLDNEMHERGYNQPRLAEALGVNQSTVSNWIRDKVEIPREKVKAIADEFGLDRNSILKIAGYSEEESNELSPVMEARMKHIENLLASIDDPRKREFIASFLDNRFAKTYSEAVDMLEQMQGLFDEQSTPPD